MAGCGAAPTVAPPPARVAITADAAAAPCAGLRSRLLPLRLAVRFDGRGRRLQVLTDARGRAGLRLAPGRYEVAPLRPALRRSVATVLMDGHAVQPVHGGGVIHVTAGHHRIQLLVALRPGECNGLGGGA
jgi:hypothetical protein